MEQAGSLGGSERVAWLDAAKFIGIFLVVLGHIKMRSYGFFSPNDFIGVFHMPLFFFLAGLAHTTRSLKETLHDAFRKLIVPYALFYFIHWAWWFPVSCLRHPEVYPDVFFDGVVKPFVGFLICGNSITPYSHTVGFAIWFLLGLFWCKLLYSIVQNKAHSPQRAHVAATLVLLFLSYVYKCSKLPYRVTTVDDLGNETSVIAYFIPFSLGTLTLSYVYFWAGTALKQRLFTNETKSCSKLKRLALLLLLFAAVEVICFFNGRTDINNIKAGNDIYLSLLGAACGIAATYELSVLISPLPRFLRFLGRNTITILAFHSTTNNYPALLLRRVFHYELVATAEKPFGIGVAMLIAAASVLMCAVPAYIFERYFPFALGRRGRGKAR